MGKPEVGQFRIGRSLATVLGRDLWEFFRILAGLDPGQRNGGKPARTSMVTAGSV